MVLALGVLGVLSAVALGGCKGDTPLEQAKSAATIATVLSSRPGGPQPVALEADFQQEKFKTFYRVWYRLPDLAVGDKPSMEFRATTSGANCGTFGGEANVMGNSQPAELKRDNEYRIGYYPARASDGKDAGSQCPVSLVVSLIGLRPTREATCP